MKPRHAACAVFLVLESPILAVLMLGWLVTGALCLVAGLMTASSSESVYRRALGSRHGRGAVFIPPGVALVAYLAGITVLGPDINGTFGTDFSQFFGTSAQVIATLLVALALGRVVLGRRTTPSALVASRWALVFVALGELAAVSASSPRLPSWAYTQAFAITVGAGLAALVAVVLVGWQNVWQSALDQDKEQLQQWADEGHSGARKKLEGLHRGPSSP